MTQTTLLLRNCRETDRVVSFNAGTGYFDEIAQVVSSGHSSTTALSGSTEAEQFHGGVPHPSSKGHTQKRTPNGCTV